MKKCAEVLLSCLWALALFVSGTAVAQDFSCPNGQVDVMKYFVLSQSERGNYFLGGSPNPIYTEVYPDHDFAPLGYWFDVKAFDSSYVYMRSTELVWGDNTTFKRFLHDLPISARCVTSGKPGPRVVVSDTTFKYYASCTSYKSSTLGTAVNDLDAPILMNAGGNLGQVWTRVLHYHYDCDKTFGNCKDEEQFFLGNGYGLWQWKHYKNGILEKSALINTKQQGITTETLPCSESYK
jgi:hypothetical protein